MSIYHSSLLYYTMTSYLVCSTYVIPCVTLYIWLELNLCAYNLCLLLLKSTRKLCYRKDDRAMRPTLWVPWKFLGLPDYAHGHYFQSYHGLLFRSTLWMLLQNLKSVALPVPEIIRGTPKNWQSLNTPTLHFLQNFNGILFGLAL